MKNRPWPLMHVSMTDCVKLPLGQHQMVWWCLVVIGDVFTTLGYSSAFGGRMGCPGLVLLRESPLNNICWLLESWWGGGLPLGSVSEVGVWPPMWRLRCHTRKTACPVGYPPESIAGIAQQQQHYEEVIANISYLYFALDMSLKIKCYLWVNNYQIWIAIDFSKQTQIPKELNVSSSR